MDPETSLESQDVFKTLSIRVFPDHRVEEDFAEFRIGPEYEQELKALLSTLVKDNKDTNLYWQLIPKGFHVRDFNVAKDSDDEEEIACPYGDVDCVQDDDAELLCDECRRDKAEAHADGMSETFDF